MNQEEKKIENVKPEFQQAEPPELYEATLTGISGAGLPPYNTIRVTCGTAC